MGKNLRKDRKELYLGSASYFSGHHEYTRWVVTIDFAEQDWAELEESGSLLGYGPEEYFKERLKHAVRPKANIAVIRNASDRRRMYDGYQEFWLPFVRYLIFAQVSVIFGGLAIEYVLGTVSKFKLFYWLYVFSLFLAIWAWVAHKTALIFQGENPMLENDRSLRFQAAVARSAEYSMWASFLVFGGTLLLRVFLGVLSWMSALEL